MEAASTASILEKCGLHLEPSTVPEHVGVSNHGNPEDLYDFRLQGSFYASPITPADPNGLLHIEETSLIRTPSATESESMEFVVEESPSGSSKMETVEFYEPNDLVEVEGW